MLIRRDSRGACRSFNVFPLVFTAGLAIGGALPALATDALSPILMTLEAENAQGRSSYSVLLTQATYDPIERLATWTRNTPWTLNSGGHMIATMRTCSVTVRQYPPRTLVNVALTAGDSATHFRVTGAQVNFPRISADLAQGRATASIGVQDMNNDGVQLFATGGVGAGAFVAQYNWVVPAGQTFTQLINGIEAGPGGTATATQNDPPANYRPLNAVVSNTAAWADFTLSAGDRASVNTRWDLLGALYPAADCNCDSRINNFDIDAFVLAISDPAAYQLNYPACPIMNADCNQDGTVDNFDIDAFIGYLQ